MKAVCDVCEMAVAVLFCATDKAVFCGSCDDQVHKHAEVQGFNCQKRGCKHVRCGHKRYSLVDPGKVAECELCSSQPAYFHCEDDYISLCLECDALIHQAGHRKRHARFLILSQQVQLVGTPARRRLDLPPLEANMVVAEIGGGQNQPPVKLEKEEEDYQQNLDLLPLPVAKAKRTARIRRRAEVGLKLIDRCTKPRHSAACKNKKKL